MDENLILAIAGTVLPFLIQALKALYEKSAGVPMPARGGMWLTFILALATGTGLLFLRGEITPPIGEPPEIILGWLGIVGVLIGQATVIYRLLLSKETRVA